MGANASGIAWPEQLADTLAEYHHVIRYDHRDTGRSTWSFDTHPYAIRDLATDAVAVLDALGIDRAHAVGMSMGGTLVQLLLLDHPDRLRSATVFATSALGAGLADPSGQAHLDLPKPDPRLLVLWQQMADERDRDDEITWRIEHWRILHGDVLPFDPDEFRALEQVVIAHTGTHRHPVAHAQADPTGLTRGAELTHVTIPTLVIDTPQDPVNPPPHAAHLATLLGKASWAVIPGMGHALSTSTIQPLAEAILTHTQSADRASADPKTATEEHGDR
jgi:pimeloyl-ACP methyl ester carboxylesterase